MVALTLPAAIAAAEAGSGLSCYCAAVEETAAASAVAAASAAEKAAVIA